ncbi:MAG TPA: histidinol dehydrogenase [Phycisphaerales bacterium]|nr:histidinol dehydrogenase [Phycisphaerales bacterium]|tara:strand:+ start:24466 stop:25791 length:1326 start_codon:yes stop_codon:yes gene_type:complete
MLPVYDIATSQGQADYQARLTRLKSTASAFSEQAQLVSAILQDVQQHGDDAIVKYMRKWTDPDFTADRIKVSAAELDAAEKQLPGDLRSAIERSIENVRQYQQHAMPKSMETVTINGAELGMRFTPMASAGMCVPGGAAVLFSTLIMLAVPAMVAGIDPQNISVINPPPTRIGDEPAGDISPIVLGTCKMLGIENVYRIGGAQAVAALAYGTQSVKPIDIIAGPGNVFVQLAKAQVAGVCGTDGGFYGPSEIVTVADESADPGYVASDLIAQAEHNPGKCFLVSWSRDVIDAIGKEVQSQMAKRTRSEFIQKALDTESCAVLTKDVDQAIEVSNTIAAEHVNLAVKDVDGLFERITNGGEFFLGHQTPVAAGDYYAGPSHCLPTGTTARFTSGISVYTFLKRSGTVCYRNGMSQQTIDDIALLAKAEGLDAHANSASIRGE